MLSKSRNVWPYLALIALSAALVADNVVATPRDGFENGFPGRVEDRLDEIQAQIADFRDYVEEFRGYVEANSSDLFDISSAICFTGTAISTRVSAPASISTDCSTSMPEWASKARLISTLRSMSGSTGACRFA
jgi:hypothetical protein